jgi:predicted Zn-dependent protease
LLSRAEVLPEGVSPDEYSRAQRRFQETNRRKPGRHDVLSMCGEIAVAEGRLAAAAASFRAIPSTDRKYGMSARLQEGQVLLRLNRAREAEGSLRKFLSLSAANPSTAPDHVTVAYKLLCYILSVELRQEERKALLADMHTAGRADVFDSKQLYFPNLLLWHTATGRRRLTEFLDQDPQDPNLRLAEGRYLTAEGRLDEALTLLERLTQERPDDNRCTAALLECLYEQNDWDAVVRVARSLPDDQADEPWLLTRMRGEFDLHEGRWDSAVRHFEQVRNDDPANPWCHVGLARSYGELGRQEAREEEQQRSLVLARIRVSLVTVKEDDWKAALKLASKCEEAGLTDAAATFQQHASRIRAATPR